MVFMAFFLIIFEKKRENFELILSIYRIHVVCFLCLINIIINMLVVNSIVNTTVDVAQVVRSLVLGSNKISGYRFDSLKKK